MMNFGENVGGVLASRSGKSSSLISGAGFVGLAAVFLPFFGSFNSLFSCGLDCSFIVFILVGFPASIINPHFTTAARTLVLDHRQRRAHSLSESSAPASSSTCSKKYASSWVRARPCGSSAAKLSGIAITGKRFQCEGSFGRSRKARIQESACRRHRQEVVRLSP